MKLHFLGAARTVTGSQYLLELPQGNVLVDCGMYQGHDAALRSHAGEFSFDPASLQLVLLTHAHIDHCGLLPRLYKLGFRGRIFATSATVDLCEVLLEDSAKIQREDAEWEQRKWSKGQQRTPPPEPLFSVEDAAAVMAQFQPVEYDADVQVLEGLSVRWVDAGHILGAASLEVWAGESGVRRKLVFSGDIGNPDRPLLRDPTLIDSADYVVMESTYGDRLHPAKEEIAEGLVDCITKAARRHGHVIIPAFAVGRTQEVLYYLDRLLEAHRLPSLPVYVDSPLASKATEVFERHRECYDEEALRMLAAGDDPIKFPRLRFTESAEESRRLNDVRESVIIISASGMCDAGRIRHHLHHHLEHGNDFVLFVGFQAQGTLGRRLVEGAREVELFGRRHHVRAQVVEIQGLSAHADKAGLADWLRAIQGPRAVFVTHGEPESAFAFSNLVETDLGLKACTPRPGDAVDLLDEEGLARYHEACVGERRAAAAGAQPPSERLPEPGGEA